MKKAIFFLILLTIIGSVIFFAWPGKNGNRGGNAIENSNTESLSSLIEQSVRAAAHLENVEYDEAIKLYTDLVAKNPKQTSYARNLAIAYLSKIEILVSRLNEPQKYDPNEVRKELGPTFDQAIAAADAAILAQPDSEAVYQVAVEIMKQKIRQLPMLADELNNELVDRLKAYLKKSPGNAALSLAFFETAEEMISVRPELMVESIEPLWQATQKHPRNIYMLHQLLLRCIDNSPERLLPAFERLANLAQPYYGDMAKASPGDDWQKKSEETLELLRQNKNEEASTQLIPWLNTIKNVSGFNPDQRLVQPKSLALVDLSDVEMFVETRAKKEADRSLPKFAAEFVEHTINGLPKARYAIWYDYDVDLTPEVLCLGEGKLRLYRWDASAKDTLTAIVELDVDSEAVGMLPVDLYEVQFPAASKVDINRRKESLQKAMPQKSSEEINAIVSRRHDLLRDCVVYGPKGIQIFSSRIDAAEPDRVLFEPVTSATGLETLQSVTKILPCDWDGDGDLDLFVVSAGKPHWMQNSGNRRFVDVSEFTDLAALSGEILAVESCDFDRDIDSDFLVTSNDGSVGVFENLLHGQFRYRSLDGDWKELANATMLTVADLDGNASWDWVGSSAESQATVMTTTPRQGEVSPIYAWKVAKKLTGVGVDDFDNDSWPDVIAWSAGGLAIGSSPIVKAAPTADLSLLKDQAILSADWVDANGDGALDVVALTDNRFAILEGKPSDKNGYVDFRVLGISDGNGGGRVNRFAVGSTLEVFTQGRYQPQIIRRDQTHFGLGSESAYNARIIFTNGLTQNVKAPGRNTLIEEPQFPKGSCPFLYGWDGEKWCFITDLLWNAPLGLQVAKGVVLPDRRWEYLKIPGELVQPVDGVYELRITEELWEAAYFDHVQLTAIDHPATFEIHSNEKVGPPSIAQPQLFSTIGARPIVSAVDQNGKDWTARLQDRDGQYVDEIGKHLCQGLVEKHYIELDLGPLDRSQPNRLMLTGWIFPTDTSLNIALDQDPVRPSAEPPSLWVPDASGVFQKVQPFMGFPGGKPKTIVIDLTNVFLADDFRVRIETSAEIYWDQAIVVPGENKIAEVVETKLDLMSADLRYRGFSEVVMKERAQPHWYDYNSLSTIPAWPPIEGLFTNFGNVKDLVQTDDDRIVVMGSGDEMVLRFTASKRELPPGWKRDFVLHSTGWDKDCDLNTLEGQSSLPLPFSTMESYPPKVNQAKRAREVDEMNRDHLKRTIDFRQFWRSPVSQ